MADTNNAATVAEFLDYEGLNLYHGQIKEFIKTI